MEALYKKVIDAVKRVTGTDFEVVEVLFLDREGVELAVEDVLALGEARFVFLELLPRRLVFPLELLLELELEVLVEVIELLAGVLLVLGQIELAAVGEHPPLRHPHPGQARLWQAAQLV